jgi:hypothetical protein
VSRSQAGGNQYGAPLLPFQNRSIGGGSSASSVRATAVIHDFEAMDEALLAQGRGFGGTMAVAPPRENPLAKAGKDSAPLPLAAIRAERRQKEATRRAECEEWLTEGDRAAEAGKPGAARVYYKMVLRRASGDLQKEAAARLALLQKPPAVSKVAKETPSSSPKQQ